MRARAVLYRSPYLILGSDKGLSFFNTRKGVAEANITRMGAEKSLIVNSVAMVGDTLFAGTSKGIFRATLSLDRLLTNPSVNIFSPDIWTRIPGSETNLFHHPGDPPPRESTGKTRWRSTSCRETRWGCPRTPPGTAPTGSSTTPRTASPANSRERPPATDRASPVTGPMILDGKEYPNPRKMVALERAGDRWFVGNPDSLFEYRPRDDAYLPIRNPNDLPNDEITMIQASRHGIYVWANPFIYKLNDGRWEGNPSFYGFSGSVDANRRGSHPFHVLGRDSLFLGTWGGGLYTLLDGKMKTYRSGNPDVCLETAVEADPTFSVVIAATPYRGKKGIFLATFHDPAKPYKMAYLELATQTLTCFQVESRDNELLSLEIIGEDLLVAVTDGGIAAYRIRDRDGRVSLDPSNLAASLRSSEATKSGLSDNFGNFWVTSGSGKMFYLPRVGQGKLDSTEFHMLDGFPGQECKSIDRDARGHIWVGCVYGGVVEIIPGRDSLSHTFRRYGVNDGLLSETVYHLSIDTSSGDVWVVTDRGLARYESASRPAKKSLSSARVFPNPFLAKHSHVIFDGLAADSEIQILTPGGSVLYSRRLKPSDGDQLRWDGLNQGGRKVAEGVYFYVIRSPNDIKRGKLIVGR